MAQFASMLTSLAATLTRLLSVVAAVSLLLGGIGILNIMRASVAERTREIGICLVIGVTAGQAMLNFRARAVVLSIMGRAIGIAVGLAFAGLAGAHMGVSFSPNIAVVAGAIVFSGPVGVVSDTSPRAARHAPFRVLRHQ